MARVVRKKGDIDRDQLMQLIDDMDGKKLQAGWFEGSRYDAQTPVAYVAAIQEFGSARRSIPPRPFMRPTIANGKDDWKDVVEEGLKEVLAGNLTMKDLLDILGLRVAGEIRKAISQVTQPPLSPITLALRKQKLAGAKIGGKLVGATAAAIAEGKTGPGELGDSAGINPKPLVFDGILFDAVTHEVSDA